MMNITLWLKWLNFGRGVMFHIFHLELCLLINKINIFLIIYPLFNEKYVTPISRHFFGDDPSKSMINDLKINYYNIERNTPP